MLYATKSEKKYASYFGDSAPILKIIYKDNILFPLVSQVDFQTWFSVTDGVGILRDYAEYIDNENINYASLVLSVKPSKDIEVKTIVLDTKYKQLFNHDKTFKCVPVSMSIEPYNYINVHLASKDTIIMNKNVITDDLNAYFLHLCFTKKYNNMVFVVPTSYGDITVTLTNIHKTNYVAEYTTFHFTYTKTITFSYLSSKVEQKSLEIIPVVPLIIKEVDTIPKEPLCLDFSKLKIGGLRHQLVAIANVMRPRGIEKKHLEKIGMDEFEKGIMLFGPPGVGKTLIARELSNMLGVSNFVVVNGPEVINKYVGESEANIRRLLYNDSDDLKVVFFDEFDAIGKERGGDGTGAQVANNIVNQILSIMDGVDQKNNILIIGATNSIHLLDSALLRPGRFGLCLEIGLPNKDERLEIFNIHLSKNIMNGSVDVDRAWLAEKSDKYSGAEIKGVCKKAREIALAQAAPDMTNLHNLDTALLTLNKSHFEEAFKSVKCHASGNGFKAVELLPAGNGHKEAIEWMLYYKDIEISSRIKTILLYGPARSYKSTSCRIVCEKLSSYYDSIVIITNNMIRELGKLNVNGNILIILDGFENLCGILNTHSYNHKCIEYINQFVNQTIKGKVLLIATMRTAAHELFETINPAFEWDATYQIKTIRY